MGRQIVSLKSFNIEDDFRSGCRNVSHHYRHVQQSFSGLHSPGRSNYTITCYPRAQITYCSTLEVRKKSSNQPYTIKRTQGRVSRHSTLAYVLGLFLKINTTVRILSSILRHSFQASGQHLVTCVHTDSSNPFVTLESTCLDITVRTCLAVQYRFSRFFVICHVRTIWTFLTAVCNITKCVGVETT